MNKKFFFLVFASAAFLLSCSADGIFPSHHPENALWSDDFKGDGPGGNPNNPNNPSGNYCQILGSCLSISDLGGMDCVALGGTPVNSCPSTNLWCVDHDYEECTNDPDYLSSAACSLWNGVLENTCPQGYDR